MASKEADASKKVVYLIGFAPESANGSVELEGFEYFISNVVCDRIRCWFIEIDASEFQGTEAESNLENLEWLTPRVMAHQQAIEHLNQFGPLYPARFATLFSSIETLRESITHWRAELEEFFAKVKGMEEWGCKIFVSSPSGDASSDDNLENTSSADGRNYLLARRRASEAKRRQSELISETVDEVEHVLAGLSADVVRRSIVQLDRSEEEAQMIGNLAVLVRPDQLAEIEQRTSQFVPPDLLQLKVSIELSGPFAPYSFCNNLSTIQTTDDS